MMTLNCQTVTNYRKSVLVYQSEFFLIFILTLVYFNIGTFLSKIRKTIYLRAKSVFEDLSIQLLTLKSDGNPQL